MNPAPHAGPGPAGRPQRSARPVNTAPSPTVTTPAGTTPAGTAAGAQTLRCRRCGQPPADPHQQILMSALWLVDGPQGPTQVRYCRACPPTGPITDLTCLICGDGPLLVGDLAAAPDDTLPAPTRAWLTTAGWRLDGPLCPTCHPAQRTPR
ncbi:hypothetical protein [Pseudonocardia sp. HH130629-09]|uniref:hypothetical protein n=1 Tax=Pseudonocardia sp. HH130629-09 TaxID=1641402 RepID=UPI0007616DB7|nr:hypothetical protein [Pseudonocardia sp. HH130629-09]